MTKYDCKSVLLLGVYQLMHTVSLGLIVFSLWMLFVQRTAFWCTWMALFIFGLKFSWWHICITCFGFLSWSLPLASYPTIKMSSAIPNTFGRSLNISLILSQSISPASATPNSSLVNLYLLNWHSYVIRYDDLFIKFQLVVSWTCIHSGY